MQQKLLYDFTINGTLRYHFCNWKNKSFLSINKHLTSRETLRETKLNLSRKSAVHLV